MTIRYFEARGAKNASLHVLVSEIEHALTRLEPSSVQAELRGSWAKLLEALALDPLAELVECPMCKNVGLRAATRCSYCWGKLTPPLPGPETSNPAVTLGID